MSNIHSNSLWNTLAARRAEIGLTVLCLFLFFWRLGDARLFDLDEGIYVSSARNMAISSDYVTPHLNSRPHERPDQTMVPFFEKPILVYWLSAASLRTFGISEGAARLPVAVASLLATLAVVTAGWRWFGRRAGLLAGLVYATAPMTVLDARQMTTDALLVLWFLLAMIAFAEKRPILFWTACALAVLTKGIVGLLLPGLVIGCFSLSVRFLVRRRQQTISPLHPARRGRAVSHAIGVLLFLCIVVPWHVAISRSGGRDLNGRTWAQEYLVNQHVGRFKGLDKHHNAPPPTYIAYFLIGFFPWACFVPFALSQTDRGWEATGEGSEGSERAKVSSELDRRVPIRQPQPGNDRPPRATIILFLKCWFWTVFLFFSASAAKLPTYIVPLYPAAALMVGTWFDWQLGQKDRFRLSKGLKFGAHAAVVTSVLLAAVALLLPSFTRNHPVMPLDAAGLTQWITLALAFGCLAGYTCLRRTGLTAGRLRAGIFTLAATMTLVVGVIAGPGYAVANRWIFGPYQDLAMLARPDAKRGIPIIYYAFGDRRPSMLFYARDYSPLERKETPLLPFLRPYLSPSQPAADVITLRSTYEKQLKPELQSAGWRGDRIATRNSGIAVWYLLRVRPDSSIGIRH